MPRLNIFSILFAKKDADATKTNAAKNNKAELDKIDENILENFENKRM